MKKSFFFIPVSLFSFVSCNYALASNVHAPIPLKIRVLNLRTETNPPASTKQSDYDVFFHSINTQVFPNVHNPPTYDFIGLEAYTDHSGEDKLIANAVNGRYALIGRGRDSQYGGGEATPIMYNTDKWQLLDRSDPTEANVQNTIHANCNQIKLYPYSFPRKYVQINPSVGDEPSSADNPVINSCQLASSGAMYPNDNMGSLGGPWPRVVTWGVFESKMQPKQKLIYVVTHFPLHGENPDVGYDNDVAKNIYTAIINPLRKAFPQAPVIFSADFNSSAPKTFSTKFLNPQGSSDVVGEGADGGDNMIKINYLSSAGDGENVTKLVRDNTYTKMAYPVNSGVIMAHHSVVADATFTFDNGSSPTPGSCPKPITAGLSGTYSVDTNNVELTWNRADKIKNVVGYVIDGFSGMLPNGEIDNLATTSFSDKDVQGAGPFTYKIQYLCKFADGSTSLSDPSDTISVAKDTPSSSCSVAPSKDNFKIVFDGNNHPQISLTAAPPSGVTSYIVDNWQGAPLATRDLKASFTDTSTSGDGPFAYKFQYQCGSKVSPTSQEKFASK